MSNLETSRTLYLDIEMTTNDKVNPKIIQIGIVEADTEKLIITREDSYYVKPYGTYLVDNYCTKLTSITDDMIRHFGRPFHEVQASLKKFGVKNKMTFAWGDDEKQISKAYYDRGIDNPFTFTNLAWLFKNIIGSKDNIGLKKAVEMVGLKFEGRPHNALADAKNTARVHLELLRQFRNKGSNLGQFNNLENVIDAFYWDNKEKFYDEVGN